MFFGHDRTTSVLASPESFRIAKLEEEKVKAMAKVDSKELVRHTLVKIKHKILNGGHKKTVLGGPKVRQARKGHSKGKNKPFEGESRAYHKKKGTDKEYHSYKGRGKDQKRKGK